MEFRRATQTSGELKIAPGFKTTAKLMLLCSPIFLSLSEAWRMQAITQLAILRPELRLVDVYHYMLVEIAFSLFSMPLAFIADSSVGVGITFLCTLSSTIFPLVMCSLPDLPYFDNLTKIYLEKFGVHFIGFIILASATEKTIFVSQMHPNSPSFRLYCFLCYFFSLIWQVFNSLVFSAPWFFPEFFATHTSSLGWTQLSFQCVLWIIMLIEYVVVLRKKHTEVPKGDGFKIFLCMYLAIYLCIRKIWSRIRWKKVFEFKTVFEPCEKLFGAEIVAGTRKVLRVFVVNMCLMYFFGMELILRTFWYHQDDEMARLPKGFAPAAVPMDMYLVMYTFLLFPITNFLIIPLLGKKMRLSDLRLLGIALVLYNASYIATMALELTLLSSAASSPHKTHVTIRLYNCMMSPVSLRISHPTPTKIFVPARMSRAYVSDHPGLHETTINSTVFSVSTSAELRTGASKMYILRGGQLEDLEEIEKQLRARPNSSHYDSHLFIINCLTNLSMEYLAAKRAMISLKSHDLNYSENVTSNVTHLTVKYGTYDITCIFGNQTFQTQKTMYDHGVYSITLFDSWDGKNQGFQLDTVDVGFEYDRRWAHIQIFLLALGISFGQISSVHYTYLNSPSCLLATCFSFQKCGLAFSAYSVWIMTATFGHGSATTSVSTTLVTLFSVFFIFLTVSDISLTDQYDGNKTEEHKDPDSISIASTNTLKIKDPKDE